jgi:hypothetical protein
MSAEHALLWSRIQSFDIDGGPARLTFAKRLARENRWAIGYAERVVEEYKRFVFLCVTAGHKCTPSDEVDQAWHLHMVYTESYWTRMCGEVLGRPLHHGPTKGGEQEDDQFVDWYERTKGSYRLAFGEEPPADVWPSSEKRFSGAGSMRRIDTSRFWLIRKSQLSRVAGFGLVLAALGLVAAGCRDLLGEDAGIMEGFVVFLIAAFLIALVVRFMIWWYTDGGDGRGSGCSSAAGGGCAGADCGGGCGGGGCSS